MTNSRRIFYLFDLLFRRTLLCWILIVHCYTQAQVSPNQVKAPLILHFCENVEWNNTLPATIVVGIYSETDEMQNLLASATAKHTIQGRPFIVKKITNIDNLSSCNILYYNKQDDREFYSIYKQAQQNNVLLISDNADEQLFVMINIVQVKDRISFKVNMPNLTVSGFTVKPTLLLNGGSLVDIKDAYQKFEQRLQDNQKKMETSMQMLSEKESLLRSKESVIKDKDQLIQQRESDILRYKSDIAQSEYIARSLKDNVKQTQIQLDTKMYELEAKDKHLNSIFNEIIAKQKELENLKSGIKTLKTEASELKEEVESKNEILTKKDAFIQEQRNKLFILLGLIASLTFTAFILYRLFSVKRKHSLELEEKVKVRTSELQTKTEDYISVFNLAPVSLWEMDFTQAKQAVEAKSFKSDESFKAFLADNPGFLLECYSGIEIKQINKATFELFKIDSLEALHNLTNNLGTFVINESINDELIFLRNKEHSGTFETIRFDNAGSKLNVIINWIDISEKNHTFSRVLVSIIDITRIRQIERELLSYQEHLELMVLERTNEIDTLNEELNTQNEELYTINEALESSNNDFKDAIEELNIQKKALNKALDDLKEAQMQMIQSEKIASLGILTAGVAHEINNPLNFIQTGIYAIEESFKELNQKDKADELSEILQHMNTGVQRASSIVKSLNTFSRKDANIIRKCDLQQIIDNTLLILNHEIKNKCTIIKNYSENKPYILGNEENIHQVFLNVINNSVQAMKSTGEIIISTCIESDKVVTTITDNGEGISDENIARIFDPFFTTKEPGRGIGLGLSIVFKIIEEHKGTIRYASELEKGTQVIITLPLA